MVIPKPRITLYTLTLRQALELDNTLLDFVDFDNPDWVTQFKIIFMSQWNEYQIAGETIGQQYQYLSDTFNEHKDYYNELLSKYIESYPELSELGTVTNESSRLHSDLPNKQLPESDYFSYPSVTDKDKSSTTSPAEILRQRSTYLRQVRPVLHEFSDRFKDCFIHIFS